MADISRELQAIMAAIYGEEVRGSIHDAIEKINLVCDSTLAIGTAVTSPTSSIVGYYDESVYINSDTFDIWKCDGTQWVKQGNIKADLITGVSKISTSGLTDTYRMSFSKSSPITFNITNGSGISSISKTSTSGLEDTYTITYTNGTTSTFKVTNGYTPTVQASKSGKKTTISITNKTGTTNTDIYDGYDPTVSISKTGKVTTITITDATGPHTAEIRDGNDGSGAGDMLKATYDKDDDGIIDNDALPIASNSQIRAAIDAVR